MTTALVNPLPHATGAPAWDDNRMLQIPPEAHTLAGFRKWILSRDVPDKLGITYLKGKVLLDMSKEEIRSHALVKTAVAGSLFQLCEKLDFGHLFINGVLVTNQVADVSNNPDMVAVSWHSLKSDKVRYIQNGKREIEIQGSPDWVLEIVSDSSVHKDTKQLREAYHQAQIDEYWIIDARGVEVEFQILEWRRRGYAAVRSREGWSKSRVFGRSFQLTRTTDVLGGFKYVLSVQDA